MAIVDFIFFIAGGLLEILKWAIIINVVLSWLFAFDVINPRNPAVGRIAYALDSFLRPVMEPFRRIIPSMGGLDLSPLIVLLIIQGAQAYLLPAAHQAVARLVAG